MDTPTHSQGLKPLFIDSRAYRDQSYDAGDISLTENPQNQSVVKTYYHSDPLMQVKPMWPLSGRLAFLFPFVVSQSPFHGWQRSHIHSISQSIYSYKQWQHSVSLKNQSKQLNATQGIISFEHDVFEDVHLELICKSFLRRSSSTSTKLASDFVAKIRSFQTQTKLEMLIKYYDVQIKQPQCQLI